MLYITFNFYLRITDRPTDCERRKRTILRLLCIGWPQLLSIKQNNRITSTRRFEPVCCKVYHSFWLLLHTRSTWLTEQDLEDLTKARDIALFSYSALMRIADEEGKPFYRSKPKLHMMDHIWRFAIKSSMNPSVYWTYQDEDMMRLSLKSAGQCHADSLEYRCLQRWMVQFFE